MSRSRPVDAEVVTRFDTKRGAQTKPGETMKLKIKKIDKAQAIELAAAHVEKVVFGLFLAGLLLFCFGAFKQKTYDKKPSDFDQAASRVGQKVTSSTFDPASDVPPAKSLPEAKDVNTVMWRTPKEWNRPVFDVKKRRPEPKFLALQDVQVATGYGAVQVRGTEAGPNNPPGRDPAVAQPPTPQPRGPGMNLNALSRATAGGAARGLPADGPPGLGGLGNQGSAALPAGAVVKGKQWAVITGLVPLANQVKEYRAAFRDVREPRPDLDYPSYHSYDVERAEVSPGSADDGDLKWVALNLKKAADEEATFAGSDLDPVDAMFLDPVLTQKLPAVHGKKHDGSVAHPKIPQGPQEKGSNSEAFDAPPRASGGGLAAAAANVGRGMALGGPRGPQPISGAAATAKKIDYKLFRFFDFTVQPGKSYRYRVRLVLQNPNHDVPVQYLSNGQFTKGATRAAPWSEPSGDVTIPRGFSLLAGGIRKATGLTDQKAEVVVRMWNPKAAVDAARIADLIRGQVANFSAEKVPIDDPTRGTTEQEIAFQTDTLVVDMTGGDTLPSAPRVRAPGQLLVLEPNGQLTVKTELADAGNYEPARKRLKEMQEALKPATPTSEPTADTEKRPRRSKDEGPSGQGLKGLLQGGRDPAAKPGRLPRSQ